MLREDAIKYYNVEGYGEVMGSLYCRDVCESADMCVEGKRIKDMYDRMSNPSVR